MREELGVPEITTHSFRKTVATLIDDEGLSARMVPSSRALEGIDDPGSIYGQRSGPRRGCNPVGPRHKQRINVDSNRAWAKNSL